MTHEEHEELVAEVRAEERARCVKILEEWEERDLYIGTSIGDVPDIERLIDAIMGGES
jgi:hypothetical protein